MSEALWRCVGCEKDVSFGDYHCPLCHTTTPKGEQHACAVISEVVAQAKPDPSTIDARFKRAKIVFAESTHETRTPFHGRPNEPITFRDYEVPKC